MGKQVIFYNEVVAVSSETHSDWSVEVEGDYSYAKEANAVPLTAVEFRQAAFEYGIVFVEDDNGVMPAVVLGVNDNESFYVNQDGSWDANYIPAFVRRYPFVFSRSEDGATNTLCIDESFAGFNQDGKGAALFDKEGKPTTYTTNVLEFHKDFQLHDSLTRAYCNKLKELELLEPMQVNFSLRSGTKRQLGGFMVVNREKLMNLPADTLAGMAKTEELEMTYLHLHSLMNLHKLGERLSDEEEAAA
ncbi:MAG: SapC family protein [Gammaproteobacteria bacterium]|nr:SapC family protein [Gammaproteobacteria bacterium]